MTALNKYARLEATALWRPDANAQRRDVFVSLGEATLVISDINNKALTHWSLAAIERTGSGFPAVFHPQGDADETLEIAETEAEIVEAIDTLRRAVARQRPRPGRLRWLGAALSVSAVAALAVFWLPGAMRDHALRVLPDVKQREIGESLLLRIERVGGKPCRAAGAETALRALASRTGAARVEILPGGVREALYLPGGTVLLNRAVVEDHEEPDVAAGYVLSELARNAEAASLARLLEIAGLRGTATLLTTGRLPARALDVFAEETLSRPRVLPQTAPLIKRFAEARLRSSPYAYAVDISGETTLDLIEGDPMASAPTDHIMRDSDWLQLQDICSE